MKDIYITWEDYHKKIEQLAKKVYEDNLKFNQIICIAKGGLRVGDVFSRLFNVPLAILSVESYPVSYTHLRAHETVVYRVCRLLLEKKFF